MLTSLVPVLAEDDQAHATRREAESSYGPPIETVISPPQTTIRMLGGMITPMTDEQAVIATAKRGA